MKKWCGVLAFSLATITGSAQQHEHPVALEKLGTVTFPNSCNAAAQAPFNGGSPSLHSFEFRRAIDSMETALTTDPSCGIAAWAIALSRWSNPFAAGDPPARPDETG